eukprot:COSAG01_NODE_6048_length_3880_cov_21.012431_2_plen_429_part_00
MRRCCLVVAHIASQRCCSARVGSAHATLLPPAAETPRTTCSAAMMFKHAAAAGPLLLLLGCLPGARSHGQMMNPANWFMTDGLPRMCPMMDGASWGIGAMWYTNYTHVPAGVPVMPDDDPRRTFTDYSATPGCKCTAPDICVKIGSGDICVPGPGVYSARNPWRAPGASPVNGPCGGYGGNMHGCRHHDGTPAPCVIGGTAHGPDARDYCKCLLLLLVSPARHPTRPHIPTFVDHADAKGKLGKNIKRTRWQSGSVVETAYILYSNHAGGYAYRLCKQSENGVTEKCFQAGHLDFVGDTHIIQWGPDKSTRKTIPAVYTTNGTHPKGSMWARGPIPTCAHANGGYVWRGTSAIDCEPYPWRPENLRKTQFPPPLPGLYGWGTDYTDQKTHKPGHYMPYFIIDRVQVPANLTAGNYVLSWRWDYRHFEC